MWLSNQLDHVAGYERTLVLSLTTFLILTTYHEHRLLRSSPNTRKEKSTWRWLLGAQRPARYVFPSCISPMCHLHSPGPWTPERKKRSRRKINVKEIRRSILSSILTLNPFKTTRGQIEAPESEAPRSEAPGSGNDNENVRVHSSYYCHVLLF